MLAATLAGILTGLLLGMVGSMIPTTLRIAVATLMAVAGVVLGALSLARRTIDPVQWDRETPRYWWIDKDPLVWSAWNGLVLGNGMTSRIGSWLWYVIPIGSVLLGSPLAGAALYGGYGLMRGALVWAIVYGLPRITGPYDNARWLIERTGRARQLAAIQLLIVCIVVSITVGL